MKESLSKSWYVYMIETTKKCLYTGISTDPKRRFEQHANKKGAKYFLMDPPIKIVWTKSCKSKNEALQIEAKLKKLRAAEKKRYIK